MTKTMCAVAVGLGTLLALAGCVPSSGGTTINLDNSADGSTVQANTGQEIVITLQTIGPGQYGPPTVSTAAVTYLGTGASATVNPGGPTQVFNFRAASAGTALITIPFSGGASGVPPFTVAVQVQ